MPLSSSSSSVKFSYENTTAQKSGLHVLLLNKEPGNKPSRSWQNNRLEWSMLPGAAGRRPHNALLKLTDPKDNTTALALFEGHYPGDENCCVHLVQVSRRNAGRRWRKGPSFNALRDGFVALNCNYYVYVIGGGSPCNDHLYLIGGVNSGNSVLDSIERIALSDLMDETSNAQWTTLNVCLSEPRTYCCGVAVLDRFMVIMGGWNRLSDGELSSVDIIDTMPVLISQQQKQEQYDAVTITPGPSMLVGRMSFGAEVLGNKIWAVGGEAAGRNLSSIEYLEFQSLDDSNVADVDSVFPSRWNLSETLSLDTPRSDHAVTKIGQCLVVAGGRSTRASTKHVNVIDPNLELVWRLPDITVSCFNPLMVYVADSGLLLWGGRFPENGPNVRLLPLVELSPAALGIAAGESLAFPTIPLNSPNASSSEEEWSRLHNQRRRQSEIHKLRMTLLYYMIFHSPHRLCSTPSFDGKRKAHDH